MNLIRIGELNNQCRLLGSQDEVAFVASELRQLSSADLPAAIGEQVSRRLLARMNPDGVYRIRRLRLNLTLSRGEFSTRRLGELLSEQLVEALGRELENPQGQVAYFTSQEEFIAQMMADLLLREGRNLWMYEDYAALRHLTPEQAVVQLLLPRRDNLPSLIPALQRRGALVLLCGAVKGSAMQLWQQWTGVNFNDQFGSDVPEPDELNPAQEWLQQRNVAYPPGEAPLEQVVLHHVLLCLAEAPCHFPIEVLLRATAHRLLLRRYARLAAAIMSQTQPASVRPPSVPAQGGAGEEMLDKLCLWAARFPGYRAYVLRLLRQMRAVTVPEIARASPAGRNTGQENLSESLLYGQRAGLVLLLPVVISLGLHVSYAMARLRGAIWLAGEDGEGPGLAEEAWLRELLPDAPQEVPTEELPPRWRLGISEQRQKHIEQLQQSGKVEEMLAQLLLAQFAARLSGLQLSSDGYLRSQFLHCGGSFAIDSAQVVARLDSVPLYIVLRMSGLAGWHSELPWSKRPLTIEIPS